ncbi:AraC family transcriptional regulator [candidate division KSB1 bacterium]|nr:AraC family transcriptional regulator [candidate division KSB1 bacterium]
MLSPRESSQLYRARIERVISFISDNIAGKLSLEVLSKAACFSQFHFHRIFTAIVGETPGGYVNRLRLAKAATMLVWNHSFSITEIAYICGFSSPATFSRSFKQQYNMSATEWRSGAYSDKRDSKNCITISKDRKPDSNIGQAHNVDSPYIDTTNMTDHQQKSDMHVEIKHTPTFYVAYMINLEGYSIEKITQVWERLCRWADPRELITPASHFIGMPMDDPSIIDREKCRYYACITVPADMNDDNYANFMTIKAGRCAVYRFEGAVNDIENAYSRLYGEWLPNSGYQPADRPAYELYIATPDTHPEGKYVAEICLPVIPL